MTAVTIDTWTEKLTAGIGASLHGVGAKETAAVLRRWADIVETESDKNLASRARVPDPPPGEVA